MKINLRTLGFVLLMTSALPAPAQDTTNPSPLAVELAVPFGTVSGKLLLLGEHMVFLDDQRPEASIVIPKAIIERLSAEGGAITIRTREAVHGRSGNLRDLNLRVAPGGDPAVVTSWYGTGAAKSASGGPATAATTGADAATYPARHNHRIGSCKGRFLFTSDQVIYESVDEISHSRRWEFKSIKEAELSNPYELEIKPFSGGSYKLLLDGTGMDPAAYKTLVDRVVAARTGR